MNVSIAVMAHPRRREMAEALSASLPGSVIVWDPDPDAARQSPWRTHREALETTPAEATHRLVIQDDTQAALNLVPALDRIAATHPERMISLFVAGRPLPAAQALFAACARDENFATIPTRPWVPAIALLWPRRLIEAVLGFVDQQPWPDAFIADDEIIGRAMTALREPCLATVPSLVEHPDVEPSLVGKHKHWAGEDPARVAACYLDQGIDALSLF